MSASSRTKTPALLQVPADFDFDVVVKRSPRRRTLEISVRNGRVHLMLPSFVSDREGLAFLRRKKDWIRQALKRQELRAEEVVERSYQAGEEFPFLGQHYALHLTGSSRKQVQLEERRISVSLPNLDPESVQRALWQWYREQALVILSRKTDAMVQQIGKSYAGIRLRKTKTKWGHCTAKGIIQYNWLIIAAPESIVDYLVAHEVSHLVHLNHSPAFWRVVESLQPDYKNQRAWLKARGHTLVI